jgi:cell division protein FtsA
MLEQLSAGVVLTGGAVLLQGMCEFAEEILGMPVRMGMPTGIKGITQLVHGPEYAAGVGLVKFGAQITNEQSLLAPTAAFSVASLQPQTRSRAPSASEIVVAQRSGFWEWIKAAF